jgi:hypothetical protein
MAEEFLQELRRETSHVIDEAYATRFLKRIEVFTDTHQITRERLGKLAAQAAEHCFTKDPKKKPDELFEQGKNDAERSLLATFSQLFNDLKEGTTSAYLPKNIAQSLLDRIFKEGEVPEILQRQILGEKDEQ